VVSLIDEVMSCKQYFKHDFTDTYRHILGLTKDKETLFFYRHSPHLENYTGDSSCLALWSW